MQATNSLDFYVQRKRSIESKPVGKAPKPPKLDQALKLVADKLVPYALTLTNDLSNAEDLCQQTLIKLIENQQKFLNAEYPYAYAKKY
jgi:DNA-directed RNA polymerase specialized sigma24 family protein